MKTKQFITICSLSLLLLTSAACSNEPQTIIEAENTNTETEDYSFTASILTSKLDIMTWNSITDDLWETGRLDSNIHYNDDDIWIELRKYYGELNPDTADISDFELWIMLRSSYLDTMVYRRNDTASQISSAINHYMSSSGSTTFDTNDIKEFDIIVDENENWNCTQFANLGVAVGNEIHTSMRGTAIKVMYKNNNCVALVFANSTEPLQLGIDCPDYDFDNERFCSFNWNSYGQQINDSFDIVGMYPAP